MSNLKINQSYFSSLLLILLCWIHRQSLLSLHWYHLVLTGELPHAITSCFILSLAWICVLHIFFNALSSSSLENAHCSASPHLNLFSFPKASKVFEPWSLSFKIVLETSYLCSLNWNFYISVGKTGGRGWVLFPPQDTGQGLIHKERSDDAVSL